MGFISWWGMSYIMIVSVFCAALLFLAASYKVECDVTRSFIIEQMERFLMGHDDRVMRGRLHYVKRDIKYKAFKFVVFPIE